MDEFIFILVNISPWIAIAFLIHTQHKTVSLIQRRHNLILKIALHADFLLKAGKTEEAASMLSELADNVEARFDLD